jgi:hypothetical protein
VVSLSELSVPDAAQEVIRLADVINTIQDRLLSLVLEGAQNAVPLEEFTDELALLAMWFNIITQRAIRRGTFRSVGDLVARIDDFVHRYNRQCHPFVWTATADSIPDKLDRLCKAIAGTSH